MNATSWVRDQFFDARFNARNAKLAQLFSAAASDTEGARAFKGLHTMSLALASVQTSRLDEPQVNLVLPELRPNGIFAGIRTAIEVACAVAKELELPLRLIPLGNSPKKAAQREIVGFVRSEMSFEGTITIVSAFRLPSLVVSPRDYWFLTHWTTAHAYDVAARLSVLDRNQAVYIVQDYEPGFDPWGTTFALARSTYHAGFRTVVNSSPLQSYLSDAEGLSIGDELVFGPSLDLDRLARASAQRPGASRRRTVSVFFYARPSKPRNLFAIGVAALSIAAEQLDALGVAVEFFSAGESHPDVILNAKSTLISRGKLPWDEYFEVLGATDVVLSLQHSPHPSHPPLDAVVCGAFAITNELGGTRSGLHERLLVAEPDPTALADQIVVAALASLSGDAGQFDLSLIEKLGGSLQSAVDEIVRLIRTEPDSGRQDSDVCP